ncbi:MAG: hypothetical protein Rhims3KO_36350 [Hyphomicrobiales bacterium]
MTWKAYLLSTCLAFLAGAGAAEPSFDCRKAASDAEDLICADAALSALDRRLAERYTAAVDAVKGLDAGSADALDNLKARQRGWIKGRDDCWKAQDLRACVQDNYLIREAELVATWMLEEPMARATYICADNPANELAVFFFDTELPSARLEYGDSIKPAWLVPAASGSKYATAFGGSLWTKGDGAAFAWQEGEPIQCKLAG